MITSIDVKKAYNYWIACNVVAETTNSLCMRPEDKKAVWDREERAFNEYERIYNEYKQQNNMPAM